MAKYRVGIIACGGIARSHARGWSQCADTEIVALADSNPQALAEFGDSYDVAPEHRYADYRAMLEREHPDIVSVCSWHGQHAEMTIAAAAQRPKVILCEKPMATSLGEADAMLTACARNNVRLAIGHMRRFYRGWEEARTLVAEGAIGTPQKVWSLIHDGLLNWGTHTIDGIRFVLGDPATAWVMGAVERKTDRYERGLRIEDAALGLIALEGGVLISLLDDLTPYGSINFQITGSAGILDVDEDNVKLLNATTNGWQTIAFEQRDPFVGQARGIVDWLDGNVEQYRGEGKLARATLECLLAIYESVRVHGVVRAPLKTRLNPLDLLVESGQLPIEHPGQYDIRSFLVRGEGMSWT
ncbi:MAG TPA: Gfo/Idh/MocA family oxidoreductase [Chloroflexota bacterium]|nr:Gfo/Idh/MocA family oxidoreductase [Chloroflexota bacterium]